MLTPLATYLLILGVAALLGAPFLLFALRRHFTGPHMLAIVVGMFAVIIVVNLYMARSAIGTFPGLEVANSYVASQEFDRNRAAQEALGWTVTPEYDGQELILNIRDRDGQPVQVAELEVVIGRPTVAAEDQQPQFTWRDGAYHAPMQLARGQWTIHMKAVASDGTRFQQRLDHYRGSDISG
ncbi:MAG: FixH family protein [Paracoccus sp. (in: a-proteobacteria)]|uniref:FixH family protein n=1 Tax=Paracoccus sp. TaxID=267 RepID=UPI0026DFC819|nr:FixH family protein [Paracoccus sp. (in: a-proteobacteria)]MDO5620587.1 FixH family protein [Paracoccus sp. (in: a-proteobacteria)]